MIWELLFMIVLLKIPVVYLCGVVWYAIKAEPEPATGGEGASESNDPRPLRPWHSWRRPSGPRPRRGGPHGSPARVYARTARRAAAPAKARRS